MGKLWQVIGAWLAKRAGIVPPPMSTPDPEPGTGTAGEPRRALTDAEAQRHLAEAHEFARGVMYRARGVLPPARNVPVRTVPGAPGKTAGYWVAQVPRAPKGYAAAGWTDAGVITLAMPPDGRWTLDEIGKAAGVLRHEMVHAYDGGRRLHDPAYDPFVPGWADARRRAGY